VNTRSTVLLCLVTLCLGGFIYFFERHTLSTDEVANRHDRLLPRFVRERVVEVEVERGERRMRVVRDREEEEALGEWMMQEPLSSRTDGDRVDAMLGALQWARPLQRLSGISEEDRDAFGLTTPRLLVRFHVADQVVPVRFGSEDPTEGGLYVQLDDPAVAYVVGVDTFEALDHEANYYRSKALFPLTAIRRAHSLRQQGESTWRLEKEEGLWRVKEPWAGLAANENVSELLGSIAGLVATRFAPEGADAMETPDTLVTGLIPGLLESPDQRFELGLGGVCGDHAGERFARADDGPVVCVTDAAAQSVLRASEQLRESSVMPFETARVQRIKISERSGTWVELSKDEDSDEWRYSEQGASALASGPASRAEVVSWLEALRGTVAEGVSETRAQEPAATVEIERHYEDADGEAQSAVYRVNLGMTLEGWWAQRPGESYSMPMPALNPALAKASRLHFVSRQLVDLPDDALRRMRITRRLGAATETEVLERRDEDEWWIVEPAERRADTAIMNGLTRRLMRLQAESYLLNQPRPANRERPEIEVRFETVDDEGAVSERRLRISAARGAGRVASLDEGPSFWIDDEISADLLEPLIARDALRVPRAEIRSVEYQAGDREWSIRREEGVFVGSGIEESRVDAILEAIAGLRMSGVRPYASRRSGPTPSEPAWRLRIVRRDSGAESVTLFAEDVEPADGIVWFFDQSGERFGLSVATFRTLSAAPVTAEAAASQVQVQVNTAAGAALNIENLIGQE
jgi:hypothetical protein